MAYNEIHPITAAAGKNGFSNAVRGIKDSVSYGADDKVREMSEEELAKKAVIDSIAYGYNDKTGEVTFHTLTSTLHCSLPSVVDSFILNMERFGMDEVKYGNPQSKDGRAIVAWHLIQSFEKEIDPMIANEIGRKLAAEMFVAFPVQISTHTNTDQTHNHIEFCAWANDGHKFHNDHETYRKIREVSDRLCKEYGLHVMEKTKGHKLVKYVDKDGVIRYYEPTDRKNELMRERRKGVISTDDVNSYRNTPEYEEFVGKKMTIRAIVKYDIDQLLPVANAYEHLLELLREIGYTVNDKRRDGTWLRHVSFQPPTADRAVRDCSIQTDGYYVRENLTMVIEEMVAEREKEKAATPVDLHIPVFDQYEYGNTDIFAIDEDYRAQRGEGRNIYYVKRGDAEKAIIKDVKKCDAELSGLLDTSSLESIIRDQQQQQKKDRAFYKKQRQEILINQIRDGLESLKFIEEHNLGSYGQINAITKALWGQYNQCLAETVKLEGIIGKLEGVVEVPRKRQAILERMEKNKTDGAYMAYEYSADLNKVEAYEKIIAKYKLQDEKSAEALKDTVEKCRVKIDGLRFRLETYQQELTDFDRCIAVLSRIDRESMGERRPELIAYELIKNEGSREAAKFNNVTEMSRERSNIGKESGRAERRTAQIDQSVEQKRDGKEFSRYDNENERS